MENGSQTEQRKMHPFERAGFGKAPFKFIGSYESKYQAIPGDPSCPIQPGSSCDYCANGIMQVCRIRSADGREFKVGNDCVRKVGAEFDSSLLKAAEAAKRKHDRKLRAARADKKEAELAALLADETVCAKLAAAPHPNQFRADRGDSLLQWAQWMTEHAGAAGVARTLKALKAAL